MITVKNNIDLYKEVREMNDHPLIKKAFDNPGDDHKLILINNGKLLIYEYDIYLYHKRRLNVIGLVEFNLRPLSENYDSFKDRSINKIKEDVLIMINDYYSDIMNENSSDIMIYRSKFDMSEKEIYQEAAGYHNLVSDDSIIDSAIKSQIFSNISASNFDYALDIGTYSQEVYEKILIESLNSKFKFYDLIIMESIRSMKIVPVSIVSDIFNDQYLIESHHINLNYIITKSDGIVPGSIINIDLFDKKEMNQFQMADEIYIDLFQDPFITLTSDLFSNIYLIYESTKGKVIKSSNDDLLISFCNTLNLLYGSEKKKIDFKLTV